MKSLDYNPGRVMSSSHILKSVWQRTSFGQVTIRIFAVFFAVFLTILMWNNSAQAVDQSVRLDFEPAKISANPAQGEFLYDGYAPLTLPSGLRLALQTINIPLQTTGERPIVSISVDRGEILGAIDPALFSQVDIPTADDGRYDNVRPALADLFEGGFTGAEVADVRTIAQGAVVQMALSPYQVDSIGNVFAVKGVTVTFSSSSSLSIGAPQTGSLPASRLLSSSALHRSPTTAMQYVIVTNKTLQPEMQRLADYKNATGIPTHVELIENILATYTGIDDAEALRNYLKDFYANGGTHALLAGDENTVPIRHTYYYNTNTMPTIENLMVSDLYFADLTGDWDTDGDGIWGEPTQDNPDLTPELHVGRLPVSRVEQAKNYVDKLIVYETDPGLGDMSYLDKTVIYSSDQMRDFPNGGQHAIIAAAMPDYYLVDTTSTVELPAGNAATPNNIDAAGTVATLNEGFGVVNIIAHGRHDGFSVRTSDYNAWPKSYLLSVNATESHGSLDQLEPNGKIGLYVALSCDLGGFDMDAPPFSATSPSFVESAVSTKLSGAVGMIGYSRWGWVYSSYRLHESFLSHLYSDADGDPVAAMNASSVDFPYYRDLIYGQNYYGDPTVRIYTDIPQAYVMTVASENWADNRLVVNVSANNTAVAGTRVILSTNEEVLTEALTDAAGNAELVYEFQLGVAYTVAIHPAGALVRLAEFTPQIVAGIDDDEQGLLPTKFSLKQNYPNPFNPSTTIEWDLPRNSEVSYRVLDILGRTVTGDNLGRMSAGRHSLNWEANNSDGAPLASGVYFFQLVTEENSATRKMTLLK